MIVTANDIINLGLNLPELLINLSPKDFFVFYYEVDEDDVKLKIFETETVRDVNISLYRTLNEKRKKYKSNDLRIGYFNNSFDTKDGLFFQLLKTFNEKQKVYDFYNSLIEQERIADLKMTIGSSNDIYNSDDFKKVITYFTPTRSQTIMFIYDMVNRAFHLKLGKYLYGDTIKKVVNLIKYDGGILPIWEGSTIKFMIIGEHAILTDKQKNELEDAKKYIRSGVTAEKAYQKTGWFLSKRDGKWRTNIADNEAKISTRKMVENNGKRLYLPDGIDIKNCVDLSYNPENIYNLSYKGKLYEILNHPSLFQHYPYLGSIPVIYNFQDKEINKPLIIEPQEFYFNANTRGGFILMNGSYIAGNPVSILLHEIQHAIQHKEGFAKGGNLFFAHFVSAVGPESVRKIFASINKMEHLFRDYLYDDKSREELINILKYSLFKSSNSKSLKNKLLNYTSNKELYEINIKTINFYLIILCSEENDTASELYQFLSRKLGEFIFEILDNISDAYAKSKKYQEKLKSEYFGESDIDTILFKGYENLYGELESRSVQASRMVESEYKNYFNLVSWENEPLKIISVIDGIEEIQDLKDIVAACECYDNQYALHFQYGEKSCIPYIHELAHIVCDGLCHIGYKETIEKEFTDDKTFPKFPDMHEYFVAKFIAYWRKNLINDQILQQDASNDIKSQKENVKISEILDEFFKDVTFDTKLQFVKYIENKA